MKALLEALAVLLLVSLCAFLSGWTEKGRAVAATPVRPIDCDKVQPQILVKSSFDGKLYKIDICAVATSAAGEDFRVEVR